MMTVTIHLPRPVRRRPIPAIRLPDRSALEHKLQRFYDRRPYGACMLALVAMPALILAAVAAVAALVALPLSWLCG